jgi:hypothetical protein
MIWKNIVVKGDYGRISKNNESRQAAECEESIKQMLQMEKANLGSNDQGRHAERQKMLNHRIMLRKAVVEGP